MKRMPFLSVLALPLAASGATGRASEIRESDRVVLSRSVPEVISPQLEIGPVESDLPMERMILSLKLRPGGREALERFLRDQHDPASLSYGQAVTPEDFGRRFGMSDEDLDAVTGWLGQHGFVVENVARSRTWINFSGTAAQVEEAFQVPMREYLIDGQPHRANASAVSIPRGLATLVNGPVSLNDFHSRPMIFRAPRTLGAQADDGFGRHALAPADLATIYDTQPLLDQGMTGKGVTIAIVGRTDINLADVQAFRRQFGLPKNDPILVHNGADPGNLLLDEEVEADLDVEWSGAMAPDATVKLVISPTTATTDGIVLSAQYIVDNNLAPVMSTSFGNCERNLGAAAALFFDSLWAQAAAQQISVFVASGDSGVAGCDPGFFDSADDAIGVNALASSPNDTAVGGTQFLFDSGLYWTASPDPVTGRSALSYVPEQAWNESGNATGGFGLWSTGGGRSKIFSKPDWQTGSGITNDGTRDLPDVALTAAGLHDPYLVVSEGLTEPVGGTSASSPAFAGIMALIVQKTGSPQGNINPTLYQLGSVQYDDNGPAVFHDAILGDNWVPGELGFSCRSGYDMATGLGSVDAAALADGWPAPSGAAAVQTPASRVPAPGDDGGN